MSVDISISIVTWNAKEYLDKYIGSIYENTRDISFEVLVADNNSADGTPVLIKTKYPGVILTENNDDLYFVKATNQNIGKSSGRYIAITTPDTIVPDNSFAALVRFLDKNPDCGAAGPMLLNTGGTLQKNGVRFPTFTYGIFQALLINTLFPNNPSRRNHEYYDWNGKSARTVEYLSGACLVIRKDLLDKTGYLDENIKMYWEDADICKRINEHGYKVCFVPDAGLIHYWGESTRKAGRETIEKIFNDSMVYYYRKHFGIAVSLAIKTALILVNGFLLKMWRYIK